MFIFHSKCHFSQFIENELKNFNEPNTTNRMLIPNQISNKSILALFSGIFFSSPSLMYTFHQLDRLAIPNAQWDENSIKITHKYWGKSTGIGARDRNKILLCMKIYSIKNFTNFLHSMRRIYLIATYTKTSLGIYCHDTGENTLSPFLIYSVVVFYFPF